MSSATHIAEMIPLRTPTSCTFQIFVHCLFSVWIQRSHAKCSIEWESEEWRLKLAPEISSHLEIFPPHITFQIQFAHIGADFWWQYGKNFNLKISIVFLFAEYISLFVFLELRFTFTKWGVKVEIERLKVRRETFRRHSSLLLTKNPYFFKAIFEPIFVGQTI